MIIFVIVCLIIIFYYINSLKSIGIVNSLNFINLIYVKDGKECNIKRLVFSSSVGLSKTNITPLMTRLNNTFIIEGECNIKKYKKFGQEEYPQKYIEYCFSKPEDVIQNIIENYFNTKVRNVRIEM